MIDHVCENSLFCDCSDCDSQKLGLVNPGLCWSCLEASFRKDKEFLRRIVSKK